MDKEISRSEFFRKLFGLALDHLNEAVERRVSKLSPGRPRPPWSIGEAPFLAACDKCRSCGEICPRGIIYYYGEGALIAAGTPFLDFSDDLCDYCGECVKACPSGALDFDGGIKDIGRALIRKNSCLACSETACRECIDPCPESAITIDSSGYPEIDEERCNGCGGCIAACPGHAIEIKRC